MDTERYVSPNFITEIIDTDLETGAHTDIVTRFPPEPNGYLHIGHAKAICLDFGVALDYGGTTYLRYDDTNPTTEDPEYVKAIQDDVAWLGFEWREVRHASDYFEQLYQLAIRLIKKGLAYVDSQTLEEIRENRGTVTTPGTPGPYRERSVEENLRLFTEMRAGEHPAGSHVLRAKIDLANENMQMRDPILYRIIHADHYRTGDEWPIYPMYDFAHPLSDAIEGITHSLCTLEFDNNRAVYDWLLEHLWDTPRPHQYEFARLQLDYTIVSKRKLIRLVEGGFVDGWDDPRMPTLVAFRRRGVRPEAIRDFANRVGIAKANSRTDLALLEHAIRDDLNRIAPRVFAVTEPLLVHLTNQTERGVIDAPSWPAELGIDGARGVPFGEAVYIERSDFELDPPKGYRRLHPDGAVRLRHFGIITVDEVERDDDGNIIALHATKYSDEEAKAADITPTAAIHWVAKHTAVPATFKLYDRLFTQPDPEADGVDYLTLVNPNALQVKEGFVEPSVMHDDPETRYQFERLGYFWRDPKHEGDNLVFNRIVTLKDSWAREQQVAKPTAPVSPAKPVAATEPEAPRELEPAVAKRAAEIVASSHVVQAEAETLAQRPLLDETWQKVVKAGAAAPLAASWVVTEAARLTDEELQAFPVAAFAELLTLLQEETITARVAKELLPELGPDVAVRELVETRGLGRVADADALEAIVRGVLTANPDEVAAYRDGKENLLHFFVGQVMRETKGTAAPDVVRELLTRLLQA